MGPNCILKNRPQMQIKKIISNDVHCNVTNFSKDTSKVRATRLEQNLPKIENLNKNLYYNLFPNSNNFQAAKILQFHNAAPDQTIRLSPSNPTPNRDKTDSTHINSASMSMYGYYDQTQLKQLNSNSIQTQTQRNYGEVIADPTQFNATSSTPLPTDNCQSQQLEHEQLIKPLLNPKLSPMLAAKPEATLAASGNDRRFPREPMQYEYSIPKLSIPTAADETEKDSIPLHNQSTYQTVSSPQNMIHNYQHHHHDNNGSTFITIPNGDVASGNNQREIGNLSYSPADSLPQLRRDTGHSLSVDCNNNHRGRLKTMFLCFIFLVLCVIFTNIILAVIHDFVPRSSPLPDIWFVFVAERPIFSRVAELCMATCGLTACYVTFTHPQRVLVASRAFYLAGLLYLARSVCMGVTLLPIPAKDFYCAPQLDSPGLRDIVGRVVGMMAGLGTEASGFRSACGDLIYSGHTIAIVLSCMIVSEYSAARGDRSGDHQNQKHQYCTTVRRWLPLVLKGIGGMGLACIMISRLHYTIDVVLAYYFTTRIFYSYHQVLDLRTELESRCMLDIWAKHERGDVITKYLWYPMIIYIEEF